MTERAAIPLAVIDAIADSIGCDDEQKRAELARGLQSIEGLAQSERGRRLPEPPAAVDRELADIVAATTKLMNALGFVPGSGDDEQKPDRIEASPAIRLVLFKVAQQMTPSHTEAVLSTGAAEAKLVNELRAVSRIRDAAAGARQDLQRHLGSGRGGARREEDKALKEMVWHLVRLHCEVTGREPGTSVDANTGAAGGPTTDFVGKCLLHLGWRKTPGAVRALIREVLKDPDPPNS